MHCGIITIWLAESSAHVLHINNVHTFQHRPQLTQNCPGSLSSALEVLILTPQQEGLLVG